MSTQSLDFNLLKYFFRSEFSSPDQMDSSFLFQLDLCRHVAGIPFLLTSTYRHGDPGFHGQGKAVDIACETAEVRFRIVLAALRVGFKRIGVYPRHIHLDSGEAPSPRIWWGDYPLPKGKNDAKKANVST